MKIKEGFVKRSIQGKTVLIPVGELCSSFHGMIELNETAEFIWDMLETENSQESIVEALTDRFNVSHEKALNDTERIIKAISDAGLFADN